MEIDKPAPESPEEKNIWSKIIGQETIKRNLNFRLQGFRKNSIILPIIFEGPWGGGKTKFMRTLAKNLINPANGEPKKYFELNGANLKSIGNLVNSVINPNQNTEYTLCIDEIQCSAQSVLDWLLSVLQASDDLTSTASYDGTDYNFDFRQQTFLFATTHPERLSDAFKSRCIRMVFEPYTDNNLQTIIESLAESKKIKINCAEEIAKYCRGIPRHVVNQFNNVSQFMEIHNLDSFNSDDWMLLRREIGILPLGLFPLEVKALELLAANKNDGMTLTFLANKLRLDNSTVRGDIEKYLLEMGLIKLDTKRFITNLGIEVLKECIEFKNN